MRKKEAIEQMSELLLMILYNSSKTKESLEEISESLKNIESEISKRNEQKNQNS